jgi:hypothetical protein
MMKCRLKTKLRINKTLSLEKVNMTDQELITLTKSKMEKIQINKM